VTKTRKTRDRRGRGRLGWTGIIAASLGTVALVATSLTAALGGFTATVVNPNTNGVATGTLLLSEGTGSTTCLSTAADAITANSANCTTIDNFGNLTNAKVGDTSNVTLTMKNYGSVAASALSLTAGACSAVANPGTTPYAGTDTSGFCGVVDVTVQQVGATSCVYPVSTSAVCPTTPTSAATLAGLGALSAVTLPGIAASASAQYKVTVLIDSSATNADQGLAATLPLTWELAQ
jgi:hypothetical protein